MKASRGPLVASAKAFLEPATALSSWEVTADLAPATESEIASLTESWASETASLKDSLTSDTEGSSKEGSSTVGNSTAGSSIEGNSTVGSSTEGNSTAGSSIEGNSTAGNSSVGSSIVGISTSGISMEGVGGDGGITTGAEGAGATFVALGASWSKSFQLKEDVVLTASSTAAGGGGGAETGGGGGIDSTACSTFSCSFSPSSAPLLRAPPNSALKSFWKLLNKDEVASFTSIGSGILGSSGIVTSGISTGSGTEKDCTASSTAVSTFLP
mmetsp:Transcript_16077/g.22194  ORF Transcript_16077/g.22194 Transcript_16077/m.22194 type:complete len:270 (+) Transcript_16077:1432-2241(+)